MQYVTYAEFLDRVGGSRMTELTDRENNETPVQANADDALFEASRRIDGYLNRYELPLSNVPLILKPYVMDVATWILCNGDDGLMSDSVRDAYKGAIDFLKRISDGKGTLGPDEPKLATPAGTEGEGDILFTTPEKRLFDRDSLKGM